MTTHRRLMLCPVCKAENNAHTGVGTDGDLQNGALTVCANCGTVSEITLSLPRALSHLELFGFLCNHPELRAAMGTVQLLHKKPDPGARVS